MVVAVDASGQLYFQNQLISEVRLKQDLLTALANARPEPLTLVLQADQAVASGAIIRLALLARDLGFRDVILGTKPLVQPGPVPARQ